MQTAYTAAAASVASADDEAAGVQQNTITKRHVIITE